MPEAKKVDELLAEMQKGGIHMALIVDEYGGVAGAVTLEDIVEEIVGEIKDEYDQGEEQLCQQIGSDEYLFQGRVTISEFNEITGSRLSDEHADTLGGYIYGELGRVPQPGEVVSQSGVVSRSRRLSAGASRSEPTSTNPSPMLSDEVNLGG